MTDAHRTTSVLIVDDQSMIRMGIAGILSSETDIVVVGEAQDGATGVKMTSALLPDVVLMDLRMPVLDGLGAIRAIRSTPALEPVRIVVLTTFDGDPEVLDAMGAGAHGFLSKGAEPTELIAAVRAAAAGDMALSPKATRTVVEHAFKDGQNRPPEPDPVLVHQLQSLTPRELEMIRGAAQGLDNRQIGEAMAISPLTVKTHLAHAMAKLDVRNRAHLVALAYRSGLVS